MCGAIRGQVEMGYRIVSVERIDDTINHVKWHLAKEIVGAGPHCLAMHSYRQLLRLGLHGLQVVPKAASIQAPPTSTVGKRSTFEFFPSYHPETVSSSNSGAVQTSSISRSI